MTGSAQWLGQVLAYSVFAALVGLWSTWPAYQRIDAGQALIKMSFSHAGEHLQACKTLDPAEVARLAPNMRANIDCPRGRVPLVVELVIDGEPVYQGRHEPTGLWGDGPSVVYEKFLVPAGDHRLEVRIRDSRRSTGFDYTHSAVVRLAEHQNLVIDFHGDSKGIRFY